MKMQCANARVEEDENQLTYYGCDRFLPTSAKSLNASYSEKSALMMEECSV
jgi:hypothetical protein